MSGPEGSSNKQIFLCAAEQPDLSLLHKQRLEQYVKDRCTVLKLKKLIIKRPKGSCFFACVQRSWTTLAGENPARVIAKKPVS